MKYIEYNNMITRKDETGFFELENDQKAIKNYLNLEIEPKLKKYIDPIKRIESLIEEGYYEDFFAMYSKEEILKIHEMVYNYNFKFQSFMAISKFYTDYSMKTTDGNYYLETYEDRIIVVSLYLGQGNYQFVYDLAKAMIEQRYQPATPTFLNSGKKIRGELVSCFLLEMEDSLNSINHVLSEAMQLSKIGGGVGINLSKLRGRNAPIKGIENAASGVLPVMKLLEDAFNYANQLGQRKGAGATYLNIFHHDLIEFLDTKKINADEKSRIQTLSLGLIVPKKFFDLAKNNEPMYLFEPYYVEKEYQKTLDDLDIDEMYYELVNNPKIKKVQISARNILQKIAQTQFESGYPYIIYKTNANLQNPLSGIGQIKMSNLCTEIFQIQTPSIINDYGVEDQIGYDINCNLGSLNIVNVIEKKNIKESVHIGMEALTNVALLSNIQNAPGVNKANKDFHSVGLGAMNLAGFFAKNKIGYESEEAKEFADVFFAAVNFYSIEKSMEIAKEKNQKFYGFEKSDYANGIYFEQYLQKDFLPKSEQIIKIFDQIKLPTKKDWEDLSKNVQKYGLYNSYRLAIAPTQSISYVQNSTASIQPVIEMIEKRTYGNASTYYPMPYLDRTNHWFYKSAFNVDQMKMLDLVATIQKHIDQGISTILFVTNETTTKDLVKYYSYANHIGLKSLYYTRTRNMTIEECLACSI